MHRLLALCTILTLGVMPPPARAQGNGPCIHQGRQVQCPPGLPPGSQSINFVPGGTNWRNSMTGAIVFVPSTTFPPFMPTPTPTAPPGPTTQPGPGTQPGPAPGFPSATDGLLTLTRPFGPPGGDTSDDLDLSGICTPLAGTQRSNPVIDYCSSDLEERDPTSTWSLGKRLTFRPGIRYERMRRLDGAAALIEGPRAGTTDKLVEESDVENAPTFEPPGDGKVDDVM